MIAFRHADPRFPFLREDESQPARRWNGSGELTHYLCDTPDGAWAEFLRHEEIDDAQDLFTIRRALWAVEFDETRMLEPDLPHETLTGGTASWPKCQRCANDHRNQTNGIAVPSAALQPGGAHGWRVEGGLQPGPARDGMVFVLFGPRPDLVGWAATAEGRPSEALLAQIRHF